MEVMIPSIVFGELLAQLGPDERRDAQRDVNSKWIVAPYDSVAAIRFAEMRYTPHIRTLIKELQGQSGDPRVTRNRLVADVMIVATAVAHGADIIYTWDNDIVKFAHGYIDAQNFLDVQFPQRLIRDGDDD
jgi:predicted nucleic acid-binding protein